MARRVTTVTSDGHGGTRIVTRKYGFWHAFWVAVLVLFVVSIAVKFWWLMIPTVLIFGWIVWAKASEARGRQPGSAFGPTVLGGPTCPCGRKTKHPITGACAPKQS